ncbi:MAG: response regulator [Acidimicrobiia bacterium]|nr:response regulator transcription factor [Acidimicrobiia bacterium]MDQ3499543.1 response regulator transcription factor [Actinomycetota bacterium]
MKLAIADDHEVVRDGIRWMLADLENIDIVGEADSAFAAIKLLQSEQPPDLMLLDLRLGGTSGFDVLEFAGRSATATRIVILSMHDEAAHLRRAMKMGAAGYVLKNGGRRELLQALETVMAGGKYVQGSLAASIVDAEEGLAAITEREREILMLVADGAENKQLARTLGLSEETVKSYLRNLFARWGVTSRAEAVATAIRLGIID